MNCSNYRERIYARYASRFKDASPDFDEAGASRWGYAYRRYLRDWLPRDKAAPILEVACGGGRLLYFLKQQGYSDIQGVDISSEQVALSRQVLPPGRVHEEDAIAFLEANPGAFSLIVGLDVVEHFTKSECLRFLEACYRALRPSGRLVLQTPNGDSPFVGGVRYGDFTHELGLTPGGAIWLLNLTGFTGALARETGPMVHGAISLVRWVLWRCLRCLMAFWNLVETGTKGSGVYTRVMLVSASRPSE